jgi:hypothetical protein
MIEHLLLLVGPFDPRIFQQGHRELAQGRGTGQHITTNKIPG